MAGFAHKARQTFYRLDGPYRRARLAERAGSTRFSKPALHGMDDLLADLLPDSGVFFEAGAHDGYTQSNTYWLECHRGWSGVLVEAIPELAAKCRARRPRSQVFNCALVADAQPGDTVTVEYGDLMSVVSGTQEAAHAAQGAATAGGNVYETTVPARTLTSVFEEAKVDRIDLAVLDIEGLELDVLRGLDLDRFRPEALLIEMLEMDAQKPAFDELLAGRYEDAGALSQYDRLYRAAGN